MARTWTSSDPRWLALNPYQRAAVMALMEADGMNPQAARNALGAMINRAAKSGEDIGAHVSKPIYQPTIEPAQQARLDRIMRSGEFHDLTSWAERRAAGKEPDPVSGATHFLAPESTMLALERKEPTKYKNWGPRGANWTGYDPATGQYRGVVMRDSSHAFLAPEGAHSVAFNGDPSSAGTQVASATSAPPAPLAAPSAAPAPTPDTDDGYPSGLLAGLFGSPNKDSEQSPFSSLMSQAQAPAIPQVEPMQAASAYPRPVDVASLLSILQQRSKLGTA